MVWKSLSVTSVRAAAVSSAVLTVLMVPLAKQFED